MKFFIVLLQLFTIFALVVDFTSAQNSVHYICSGWGQFCGFERKCCYDSDGQLKCTSTFTGSCPVT